MPDLERDLATLGAELEWPATPDIAGAVVAQLTAATSDAPGAGAQSPRGGRGERRHLRPGAEELDTRRQWSVWPRRGRGERRPLRPGAEEFDTRRRWGGRRAARQRALVVALVVALLALPAAALAFPGARDAVLDWLGLRHVAVERATPRRTARPPTPPTFPLDVAARRAGLTPLVPPAFADARAGVQDGRLILRQGDLRLEQARGTLPAIVLEKLVGSGTGITRERVAGQPALWFPEPHAYLWAAPDGSFREGAPTRSGPSLVWEQAGLVVRLEGPRLTHERALAIAGSARRHSPK